MLSATGGIVSCTKATYYDRCGREQSNAPNFCGHRLTATWHGFVHSSSLLTASFSALARSVQRPSTARKASQGRDWPLALLLERVTAGPSPFRRQLDQPAHCEPVPLPLAWIRLSAARPHHCKSIASVN